MILINKVSKDRNRLLNLMPYVLKSTEQSETLETVIMPDEQNFYLGEFEGSTIICDFGLPFEFYSEELSKFEGDLIEHFPDSTIIALSLISTVNHYGFAIIENGEKARVKVGDSSDPVAFEFGESSREEIALQKDSRIDENGSRIFNFEGEQITEDCLGEEYVFEISKRIFGFSLNGPESDELLFETQLTSYLKS